MGEEPVARVDRDAVDPLGRRGCHFLDIDAARGAHHQHGALRGAVDDDPDVALRRDVGRGRHQHLVHGEPLDRHPQDLGRLRSRCVGVRRELHAPCLAPPPRVHLGLHHDLPAQALRDGAGLGRALGDLAVRDGDAVALEDVPRLILVQVHACSKVIVVPASPRNAGSP